MRYVDSLLVSLRSVAVGNVAYASDWTSAPVLTLLSLARRLVGKLLSALASTFLVTSLTGLITIF
jgi:hypothetical protein